MEVDGECSEGEVTDFEGYVAHLGSQTWLALLHESLWKCHTGHWIVGSFWERGSVFHFHVCIRLTVTTYLPPAYQPSKLSE